MKNTRLILAVCIVIVLCSFAAPDWVDLKSAAGRFSMKFPRQPTPQTQDVNTGNLHLKLHMHVYDASKYKDDNLAYVVMYCDYPSDMVNSDFRDEIVDTIIYGGINSMAESMEGKIISIEKSNYKDFPGKRARVDVKKGEGYAYVKIYLVHSRMYLMEVVCDTKNDHNASIEKFFDSFVLQESKPAEKKPATKH
jgi:hypothetical protein